jgi:hypothetical protein
MEVIHYPRILVITENPPRDNSLGFGRTLTNILKDYPIDRILYYVPDNDFSHPDFRVFQSNYLKFGVPNKRRNEPRWWAPFVNKVLNFYNHSFQSLRKLHHQLRKINEFNPDVIFLVPMMYSTLLEASRITKAIRKPLFIYLMDDSMNDKGWHWGGRRQSVVKRVLKGAAGWVMISKYLADVLGKRYGIAPKGTFILHNPVEASKAIKTYVPLVRNKFVIAYAGSIHTFHDALFNVAQAVYELQCEGFDIELKIYTRQDFWDSFEPSFRKWNVANGGFIPYNQLFQTLTSADLLLCTTSFEKEHYPLVATSVFTKLTDYMASGRLVWSYGPSYSANNRFMEENNIGITFQSPKLGELKDFIKMQVQQRDGGQLLVEKQTRFLLREADASGVTDRFSQYLQGEFQEHF